MNFQSQIFQIKISTFTKTKAFAKKFLSFSFRVAGHTGTNKSERTAFLLSREITRNRFPGARLRASVPGNKAFESYMRFITLISILLLLYLNEKAYEDKGETRTIFLQTDFYVDRLEMLQEEQRKKMNRTRQTVNKSVQR